jgi:hypothetical protein
MSPPKFARVGGKNPLSLLTVGSGWEKYGRYKTGTLFKSRDAFL